MHNVKLNVMGRACLVELDGFPVAGLQAVRFDMDKVSRTPLLVLTIKPRTLDIESDLPVVIARNDLGVSMSEPEAEAFQRQEQRLQDAATEKRQ